MSKPDEYDLCFRCEHCVKKRFGYWSEAVCTFNGDDDRTVYKRLIKKMDECPKEVHKAFEEITDDGEW